MICLKRQQHSLFTLFVLGWLVCAGKPITVLQEADLGAQIALAGYSMPAGMVVPAERLPRLEKGTEP